MDELEIEIEHRDLDVDLGGDGDDGDESPLTAVYVTIATADGMRYSAYVACEGDPGTARLASMVVQTAQGAAGAHSPGLRGALLGGVTW